VFAISALPGLAIYLGRERSTRPYEPGVTENIGDTEQKNVDLDAEAESTEIEQPIRRIDELSVATSVVSVMLALMWVVEQTHSNYRVGAPD
jgi:hypothetical protein